MKHLVQFFCFLVNVATALAAFQQPKLEIGLLDADVFGPSIPLMMNLNESPLLTDGTLHE